MDAEVVEAQVRVMSSTEYWKSTVVRGENGIYIMSTSRNVLADLYRYMSMEVLVGMSVKVSYARSRC